MLIDSHAHIDLAEFNKDRDQVMARELPLGRLLLETDAPFLTPQVHRGKRNEPAYVALTAEKVAEIRQVPVEVVADAAASNTIELFRLPVN